MLAVCGLLPEEAHAADPFEIQVYDGTANGPGVAGLELHLNEVLSGLRESEPPELPLHHQTHLTLEPSLGITRFWELGGYLQSSLRPDGTWQAAGAKLRSKLVLPGVHLHLRLGLNIELSRLPVAFDRSRWGSEIRPIVAWEDEHVLLAANPIVGVPLAQPGLRGGPTFEPAAMAKAKVLGLLALGLEYYGDLGPIRGLLPLREQEHILYETVDLLALDRLELNIGVGEGLTRGTNPLVVKAIVGWSFEGR